MYKYSDCWLLLGIVKNNITVSLWWETPVKPRPITFFEETVCNIETVTQQSVTHRACLYMTDQCLKHTGLTQSNLHKSWDAITALTKKTFKDREERQCSPGGLLCYFCTLWASLYILSSRCLCHSPGSQIHYGNNFHPLQMVQRYLW